MGGHHHHQHQQLLMGPVDHQEDQGHHHHQHQQLLMAPVDHQDQVHHHLKNNKLEWYGMYDTRSTPCVTPVTYGCKAPVSFNYMCTGDVIGTYIKYNILLYTK